MSFNQRQFFSWVILGWMSLFLRVISRLVTSEPGSGDEKFQEPFKSTESSASRRSLDNLLSREWVKQLLKEFGDTPEGIHSWWNITAFLRCLVREDIWGTHDWKENMIRNKGSFFGPIELQWTRQNWLPSNGTLGVCTFVRLCLGLILLIVRWVSVKRITTVSLLYPHTLSPRPTFTRPTFNTDQLSSSTLFHPAVK